MTTNLNIFIRENKAYRFHFDDKDTSDIKMKRYLRTLNQIQDEEELVKTIKSQCPAQKDYVPGAERTWQFKYGNEIVDVMDSNWNEKAQNYTCGNLIDEIKL